jgi:protein tyrosine/serine phosphatase
LRRFVSIALAVLVTALVIGLPVMHYRAGYDQSKRLRVVTDGRFYRSGQLTAEGFRDAHAKYGFKTVINLQEEARDPLIPLRAFGKPKVRQSEVLAALDVKAITIDGGELEIEGKQNLPDDYRPPVVDEFLKILDDPENYPILIHCKAGLHRTGLMTAIYRMEYEHRSVAEVMEELKANGFGTFAATEANVYVKHLIQGYRPGVRRPATTTEKEGGK